MTRKTLIALAAGLALGLPAAAAEMTLDEILAKHYEAMGGLEAIKGLGSARISGTMTIGPGVEAPFTLTFKRPQRLRLEFTIQGMTGVRAYDGETAWALLPFLGKTDAEVMPADEARDIKEQADFDGPLVDFKDKGHQVELLGEEDVEGTRAYKLKITLASGELRWTYLDAEYFIPIKQEAKTTSQGREIEFETTLSDYKEVGGLQFPHSIESKPKGAPAGQVLTVKQFEVNPDVADDVFAMPPKAAAPAAG